MINLDNVEEIFELYQRAFDLGKNRDYSESTFCLDQAIALNKLPSYQKGQEIRLDHPRYLIDLGVEFLILRTTFISELYNLGELIFKKKTAILNPYSSPKKLSLEHVIKIKEERTFSLGLPLIGL